MKRKTKRSLTFGSLLLLFFTNLCVLTGYTGAKSMPSDEKSANTAKTERLSPGDFITVWDLSKSGSPVTGTTTSIEFQIKTKASVDYTWTSTTGETGSGIIPQINGVHTIAGLPKDAVITLELKPENLERFWINKKIDAPRLINVAQWGTAKWDSMLYMFSGCINLDIDATDIPDLGMATSVQDMFKNCTSLSGPSNIASWNVEKIRIASGMFYGASSFNQDISGWNTASARDFYQTFYGASSFNQNLGAWDLTNVHDVSAMLSRSGLDCANYSATLMGWAANPNTPDELALVAEGLQYGTHAEDARNILINDKGWQIYGDASSGGTCIVSRDFITKWDLSLRAKNEIATISSITFQIVTDGPVEYTVKAENGATLQQDVIATSDEVTIANLPVDGKFTLYLKSDNLKRFFFIGPSPASERTPARLVEVQQWGDAKWTSMVNAFMRCENLEVTATDKPDLSGLTDLQYMFYGCEKLTGSANINDWDISKVTSLHGMFQNTFKFNQPLDRWNTSAVTDMSATFSHAEAFDQDISGWNTEKVTSMKDMFAGAAKFNQPIGMWSTGEVEDMEGMFDSATDFDQDLSSWTTGKVTNMSRMFKNTTAFNQDISGWTTSAVNNMSAMFMGASTFNQAIGTWNTAAVTNMSSMFELAIVFNQSLGTWNTAAVTDMSKMFSGATAFNRGIGSFRLDGATDLTGMLDNSGVDCINYSKTLINWSLRSSTPSGLTFGAVGRSFGAYAQKALDFLENTKNWTITDGGPGGASCLYQSDFVTEWDLSKPGTPAESGLVSIEFMMNASGDVKYSWTTEDGDIGEGTIVAAGNNIATISDLPEGKKIVLSLDPTNLRRFYFDVDQGGPGGRKDRERLVDVKQWGATKWTSMSDAFENCSSLEAITATDIPDLTLVDNMHDMFKDCKNLVSVANIGQWNTSVVKDMSNTFSGAEKFNEDISSWNTSAVTTMENMFNAAKAFNQNINSWETGLVSSMRQMFYKAEAFNQNISNWNTTKVENMSGMFWEASAFNGTIGDWNTAAVTDMSNMFYNAPVFNQDLRWNTAMVTDMRQMFNGAKAFNGRLDVTNSNWNTGRVTTMEGMFSRTDNFNQPIGDWDVGNVTTMYNMFFSAAVFNQDISGWDTKNVETMKAMFYNAVNFNQDLQWNTVKVTTMEDMFSGATVFNGTFGPDWNTAAVTSMSGTFANAKAFTSDLNWNTSKVTTMYQMFDGAESFNGTFGPDWNTSNVTTMYRMFRNAKAFDQDVSGWNTAKVNTMYQMYQNAEAFNQDVSGWNVASVTTMYQMFSGAKLFNRNLESWTLTSITSLTEMLNGSGLDCFNYSSTLIGWAENPNTPSRSITLGAFKLTYGTNAQAARDKLTSQNGWTISGDSPSGGICGPPMPFITEWDLSKPGSGSNTIGDLTSIEFGVGLNGPVIYNWKTVDGLKFDQGIITTGSSNYVIHGLPAGEKIILELQSTNLMNFSTYKTSDCERLVNVAQWGTSRWTTTLRMFSDCVNLDIDATDIPDLRLVTVAQEMFANCSSLTGPQNINDWNVETLEAMWMMFYGTTTFDQSLQDWNLESAQNIENMLDNSGLSCYNYSNTLKGWAANTALPGSLKLGAAGLTYGTNAKDDHDLLTKTKNWIITGDIAGNSYCGVQLPQTINPIADIVKTYGDADFDPMATATSGLEVTYVSADNSIAEYDPTTKLIKIKKVGTVMITAKQPGNDMYLPADDVTFSLTVNKAAITITPDATSKVYGAVDPELTYVATDASGKVVNLSTVITGKLTRVVGEDVGAYDILQGTLSAGSNYTVTFITGKKLTITAQSITITPDAKSKVYGDVDPELTYVATDASGKVVNLSTVITGKLTRVVGEDVGAYAIQQGTLSAGSNYTVTFITGKKLTITKAVLTGITFESKEFVYDGNSKRLELKGNIPAGAQVKYTNNDQVNAGTYKVTAEIIGTANYDGTSYDAVMTIHKAKQTIVFKAPIEVALEEEAIPLDVYATSGLPVTLTVNDPLIATVTGTVLKPQAEGTVQVTATQAGHNNYEAATPVIVSIKIVKKDIPLKVRPHKAVSPNYDGINEFFKLDGIEHYPDNKVTIFDKNAVVMAEIVGYNNQDKRYTGEWHRDGTYYYYLDVRENGVWRREKGYFVVRR